MPMCLVECLFWFSFPHLLVSNTKYRRIPFGKQQVPIDAGGLRSPPISELVDDLPPNVVDYLPLWPGNRPWTESNLFLARSTC